LLIQFHKAILFSVSYKRRITKKCNHWDKRRFIECQLCLLAQIIFNLLTFLTTLLTTISNNTFLSSMVVKLIISINSRLWLVFLAPICLRTDTRSLGWLITSILYRCPINWTPIQFARQLCALPFVKLMQNPTELLKVPMKWKIIAAYLKVFFLSSLVLETRTGIFVLCKWGKWWRHK